MVSAKILDKDLGDKGVKIGVLVEKIIHFFTTKVTGPMAMTHYILSSS